MRIEETKVYTFGELSDESKQTAIEEMRRGSPPDDWWEDTIDFCKEILADFGFENAEIQFSGFCSQGDGASFTADIDVVRVSAILRNPPPPSDRIACANGKEQFVPYAIGKIGRLETISGNAIDWVLSSDDFIDDFDIRIVRGHSRYCHENTCSIEWSAYGLSDTIRSVANDIAETIEELRRDLCCMIFQLLEAEYWDLTSDETLSREAIELELEFMEDGKIF